MGANDKAAAVARMERRELQWSGYLADAQVAEIDYEARIAAQLDRARNACRRREMESRADRLADRCHLFVKPKNGGGVKKVNRIASATIVTCF